MYFVTARFDIKPDQVCKWWLKYRGMTIVFKDSKTENKFWKWFESDLKYGITLSQCDDKHSMECTIDNNLGYVFTDENHPFYDKVKQVKL